MAERADLSAAREQFDRLKDGGTELKKLMVHRGGPAFWLCNCTLQLQGPAVSLLQVIWRPLTVMLLWCSASDIHHHSVVWLCVDDYSYVTVKRQRAGSQWVTITESEEQLWDMTAGWYWERLSLALWDKSGPSQVVLLDECNRNNNECIWHATKCWYCMYMRRSLSAYFYLFNPKIAYFVILSLLV